MGKRTFKSHERVAIWQVNDHRCVWCTEPVALAFAEVDHIVPETFIDKPAELKEILEGYQLPPNFKLNEWKNWTCFCGPCNKKKSKRIIDGAPKFLDLFSSAKKLAPKAKRVMLKSCVSQNEKGGVSLSC